MKMQWSVYSKSDPRWNKMGEAVVGTIFDDPEDMLRHIKDMQLKYGDKPHDLHTSIYVSEGK